MLMPGLGHIYCGRVGRGLLVWAAALGFGAFTTWAWLRYSLTPLMPVVLLAFGWTMLQLALVGDLARFVRSHGADYRLRPVNHPLAYVAIFLGLGVLPVLVGGLVASWRVGSIEVRSMAMFPQLLPGDRVLYDRRAFGRERPDRGDLVVVAWPEAPRQVARVLAAGGETIELRDGRPVVDGAQLGGLEVGALRVPNLSGPDTDALAALEGHIERAGLFSYVVTYDIGRGISRDPPPVVLADDELFVLGDNRDDALRSERYGRVRVDDVVGRPRYVWASWDRAGRARPGRAGLELR